MKNVNVKNSFYIYIFVRVFTLTYFYYYSYQLLIQNGITWEERLYYMPYFQVDRNGHIFALLLTLLFVWLFFERGMDKLKYFWFAYVAFIWLSFFAQIFIIDGINIFFANINSFFFFATAPTLIFSGITVYKLLKKG